MEKKEKILALVEKISLRIFWLFMFLCAGSFLGVVWSGGEDSENEIFFKITFTFFVIGLASFLVWLPIVIYKVLDIVRKK